VPLSAPSSPSRSEVAVVRQPIADARLKVVGYELLFGADGRALDPGRDAQSTSALLVDAFGDIGLEQLAGAHPAWVSVAREFLVEVGPPPFRPDRVVLQIGAAPAPDHVLALLQGFARSGYTIALTDYDGRRDIESLLALCSIVKVDASGADDAELARVIALPQASGAVLVATGVADGARFEACQALGFTYFQGPFFAQPRLVRRGSVASGGLSALRGMAQVSRSDLSFEEVERVIASDIGLSLKLLRYVNSAFFSLPRTVGSVREALTMLGTRTVRRWATVMALAALPDAPSGLVAVALQRGRMCEMLAHTASAEEREGMFTVGLFSVADALLDTPMAQVLDDLPFSEEIRAALLGHEGPKGEILATVIAYEQGQFPRAPDGGAGATLAGTYRSALEWASQAQRALD